MAPGEKDDGFLTLFGAEFAVKLHKSDVQYQRKHHGYGNDPPVLVDRVVKAHTEPQDDKGNDNAQGNTAARQENIFAHSHKRLPL